MPRGVTLLELLLVLVLMTVATALVVPVLGRREPASAPNASSLIASARRTAIRRAEPVAVHLLTTGDWTITAQRDGALIDSGHIQASLPYTVLLVDALGACVPAPFSAPAESFDPLSCEGPAVQPTP